MDYTVLYIIIILFNFTSYLLLWTIKYYRILHIKLYTHNMDTIYIIIISLCVIYTFVIAEVHTCIMLLQFLRLVKARLSNLLSLT